jgi:uncharacterized membrane protein YdbT with pleckstrin-like domain
MEIETFDGQRDDEEITAAWRQHPMVLSRPLAIIVLLIFVGSIPALTWTPSWWFSFWLLFIVVGGIYGLLTYFLWLNTLYILTNERILAVFQRAFLMRATNEVPLKNIQNVAHIKKGLFQMLFDYGSVEVETAGTKTAMTLKNIEPPYSAQQKILNSENKTKDKKND